MLISLYRILCVSNRYVQGIHAPGRCSDRSKCKHGDSATEGALKPSFIPPYAYNKNVAIYRLYRSS